MKIPTAQGRHNVGDYPSKGGGGGAEAHGGVAKRGAGKREWSIVTFQIWRWTASFAWHEICSCAMYTKWLSPGSLTHSNVSERVLSGDRIMRGAGPSSTWHFHNIDGPFRHLYGKAFSQSRHHCRLFFSKKYSRRSQAGLSRMYLSIECCERRYFCLAILTPVVVPKAIYLPI